MSVESNCEENTGHLPLKWLLSWISMRLALFRPKLYAMSWIKLDIMKEPSSGNLYFLIKTFREGWTGVKTKRPGPHEVIRFIEFLFFSAAGRVYVWRQSNEAVNPDCFLPTVKHKGGSVMVWTAISWTSVGPIVALHGRISSNDYLNILWTQDLPMF